MAIDLTIQLDQSLAARDLRRGTEETLRQLLSGTDCPKIVMHIVHGPGQREEIADEVLGRGDAMYALTFQGFEDQVSIFQTHDFGKEEEPEYALTFSVGATRSASEHALALAGAIYAGGRFKGQIDDGFAFWTGVGEHDPSELFESVRLKSRRDAFADACTELLGARLD